MSQANSPSDEAVPIITAEELPVEESDVEPIAQQPVNQSTNPIDLTSEERQRLVLRM